MRASIRFVMHATAAVAALSTAAAAQRGVRSDADWLDDCRTGRWNDDRERACEVRQVPLELTGRALEIDGGANGSVHVHGWDGDSVRVTARIEAWGDSNAEAEAMLREIRITSTGRAVRAEGPSALSSHRSNWSASYDVRLPRRFDVSLDAKNGSLGVEGVSGNLQLRTTNGGVTLRDVGGEVHARTQNGSLHVELAGAGWQGNGLDAETHNGSVRLALPERYAALIETGTVHGRLETDFPVTLQGRLSPRRLSIPLNGGGKTLRVMTTNGSVRLSKN